MLTGTVTHRLLTLTHVMKSFVAVLALAALAAADVSHLNQDAAAQTVQLESDVGPVGYKFLYQTSNGISGQESGQLQNAGSKDESISVQGSNAYTAPDGTSIRLSYTADENGYHPQGDHLPTPPPPQDIPEYILRSLAYIAAHPPAPETYVKKN